MQSVCVTQDQGGTRAVDVATWLLAPCSVIGGMSLTLLLVLCSVLVELLPRLEPGLDFGGK